MLNFSIGDDDFMNMNIEFKKMLYEETDKDDQLLIRIFDCRTDALDKDVTMIVNFFSMSGEPLDPDISGIYNEVVVLGADEFFVCLYDDDFANVLFPELVQVVRQAVRV